MSTQFTDYTPQSRPQLPKEKIYDEQLHPLVSQITDICRKNNIAMIIDIALGENPNEESHLKCTSINVLSACEPPMNMLLAARHLHPETATQAESATMRALAFIDHLGLMDVFTSQSPSDDSESLPESPES